MAPNRPRATPDFARLRDRLMSIYQGCVMGQILTATIIVDHICTTGGQMRCPFDALPAGGASARTFSRKTQKENIGSGTGSSFLISRQVRPRYACRPPAPSGHPLRKPFDPEHCLVHRAPRVHHFAPFRELGEAAAQRVGSAKSWLESRADARRMRLAAACLLVRFTCH